MSHVKVSAGKFYKLYKFFLQTKIEKTKSSYKSKLKCHFLRSRFHRSKLNIHQNSWALNYLLLKTKEGFIKWERCQHVSTKFQKTSVYPGDMTLVAERILFGKLQIGQKLTSIRTRILNYEYFFECILYPQALIQNDKIKTKLKAHIIT